EVAVKAMQEGAVDFIQKPYTQEEVQKSVRRALDRKRLLLENLYLRGEMSVGTGDSGLIGESPVIKNLVSLIERVAKSDATVLILGESGSGKELVARAIHNLSPRAQHSFIPINCIAIPDELLESQLFGHVKGSFTGATQNRIGMFELADQGTIFLDEIGDMNQNLQGKILRVLQEQTIEPVGGRGSKKVDVRVVAATNRDLEAAVKEGTFREDLYFRLNVVPLEVPPLRDRKSDVPLLVRHFMNDLKKTPEEFFVPPSIYDRLMKYDWPGNVRELRNLVERAVVLDSPELLGQIGSKLSQVPEPAPVVQAEEPWLGDDQITYKEAKQAVLDRFERKFFEHRLRQNRGNVSRTAETLGMHRKNLQEKLDRLGINPKEVTEDQIDPEDGS
ncbi:MAG: sigma-54-dependent Fis family transcriptional regulator, partial [Candidatus Omnitrophica bacterium]|nr:sigma-54-dependent Fis family transcriptional regulator [Candidatus Omnitrophota bacterium]